MQKACIQREIDSFHLPRPDDREEKKEEKKENWKNRIKKILFPTSQNRRKPGARTYLK